MPVHKVMVNGKPGYKWGSSGKVYTGPGAAQKAAQQGQAVYASGYKKAK
jgi:hypothetical protein